MKYVPIGRILSTHGLNGEVKFRYYNEVKEDFSSYTSLFIPQDYQYRELKFSKVRIHKGLFLLSFEGLTSPEQVHFCMNREVFVPEDALPELDGETYYDYQLVGLSVISHGGEEVGRVSAVLHRHGTDFVVVTGREEERFLPMIEDYIAEVNLAQEYIKISESAVL